MSDTPEERRAWKKIGHALGELLSKMGKPPRVPDREKGETRFMGYPIRPDEFGGDPTEEEMDEYWRSIGLEE